MRRVSTIPRRDWRPRVERQGLIFHTLDDGQTPYWNESAYYEFTRREIDVLELATQELDRMCLAAVEHVLEHNLLSRFGIDPRWHDWLCDCWEADEHTIVGRFDLAYDGSRPPAMLEYNADTPTGLLEAAVIQWHWLQDQKAGANPYAAAPDQFNSLHERLIEAWQRLAQAGTRQVHFASLPAAASVEDYMTVTYLRDTAIQAGLRTDYLAIADIGWNERLRSFVDLEERAMSRIFKLYPWEWMLGEEFAQHLSQATTSWLEPPWKMILSCKALLPLLHALFPDSPYILAAHHEPWGRSYVRKPLFSREGAGVTIVADGTRIADTHDGEEGPFIYQELRALPEFEGRHPVIGSWMINGYAAGIGIRESAGLITNNTSQFVPHLFL